jgi:putative transposase
LSHSERVALAEWHHPTISLARQSDLLDIARSSLYYVPVVNARDVKIMHHIDEIYTDIPFYGSRKMRFELIERHGITICRDHVRRLMRLMGIEAIYPKSRPHTSLGDVSHKKYPYLLAGLAITHPDHVWSSDITYVRLAKGFCYLTAILDWFSRYVVAWELSETLESDFCIRTLQDALLTDAPVIHNSDQGVQYTSEDYLAVLEDYDIRISMDARGRCFDNIFTERLWRTVKYENVYLQSYRTVDEARAGLSEYFPFYHHRRKHQALGYRTPEQLYLNR